MFERYIAVGEEIERLNERLSELRKEKAKLEAEIISHLDEGGYEQIKFGGRAFSSSSEIVPKVMDWDEVHDWVLSTQTLALLHRRVSKTAYVDLLDAGETIPGIEPEVIRKLKVRRAR